MTTFNQGDVVIRIWGEVYVGNPCSCPCDTINHVQRLGQTLALRGVKTMKYDPQKHHRRSIRLKGYDYAQPGAYFVTICTYQRDEIFGEVINGEMRLSALGKIVREEWLRSAEIRKEIQIFEDEFMIMPNHFTKLIGSWIPR